MVHPLHRRRQLHAENMARDEAEAAQAQAGVIAAVEEEECAAEAASTPAVKSKKAKKDKSKKK